MGTGVSSPAVLGPPARAPPVAKPPGKQQDRARWGPQCRWHLRWAPSTVLPWGSSVGRGLGVPLRVRCQPHLLLAPLSRDGFQLLLLAQRRQCQQQHSRPLGTHCILPVLVPSWGCWWCPVQPQLLSAPSVPCQGCVVSPCIVPPVLRASVAGSSVEKWQGALTNE